MICQSETQKEPKYQVVACCSASRTCILQGN